MKISFKKFGEFCEQNGNECLKTRWTWQMFCSQAPFAALYKNVRRIP